MNDLIQAFFERDLSPEESDQLVRVLENSGEESLRFASLGEAAYQATGLPAHHWPGANPWAPGSTAAGKTTLLKIILASMGLGAAWWAFHKPAPPVPAVLSPVKPLEAVQPSPAQPRPKQAGPLPSVPGLEGKNLQVEVDVAHPGLVTVRVLGPQGDEVRHLYTGFLQKGGWRFAWDGLLADGKAAPEGHYLIEVKSDQGNFTKLVDLASHP